MVFTCFRQGCHPAAKHTFFAVSSPVSVETLSNEGSAFSSVTPIGNTLSTPSSPTHETPTGQNRDPKGIEVLAVPQQLPCGLPEAHVRSREGSRGVPPALSGRVLHVVRTVHVSCHAKQVTRVSFSCSYDYDALVACGLHGFGVSEVRRQCRWFLALILSKEDHEQDEVSSALDRAMMVVLAELYASVDICESECVYDSTHHHIHDPWAISR